MGYGDNTIAWEPAGLAFSSGSPDQVISVDVRNVIVGGVAKDYRYTVTVIDPAACAFTVTPQFAPATASARTGTVAVTASSPSCAWTAGLVSGSPWLTITSGPGGTGSGEVSYQVAANTGSARTGTMTIAGTTVTIAQDAPQVTPYTYYLAEGATGSFFDLDIVIANPNDVDAPVAMTFLDKSGRTYPLNFTLPAKRSRTVAVEKEVAALASTDVSTIVTSSNNLPLVVERSLFWDATYYGGHTGNAVDGPQTTWYFGEGFQSSAGSSTRSSCSRTRTRRRPR